MDKTYGHVGYGCASGCCYHQNPNQTADPLELLGTGSTAQQQVWTQDCTGTNYDVAYLSYNWWAGDGAVASVTDPGYVTANGVGTTTANAYVDLPWGYSSQACTTLTMATNATINVKPTISGPNVVWWFNGENPSGYATSITLTSSGGAGTIWGVIVGSEKVTLNAQGSTATITSSGSSFSSSVGDVQVTAQASYVTSQPFHITTRRPYKLVPGIIQTQCGGTYTWTTTLNYAIQDNLSIPMPTSVPLNEKWTTAVVADYTNMNWRRGDEGGITTDSGSPSQFADSIQGEVSSFTPTPDCNGSATPVYHWGQEWRVGSSAIGSGARVQGNTLQKYINHASHTSITSPMQ
jgi:hypothetical protein